MADVRLIDANKLQRWLKMNMANTNPLHCDIRETYSECITMVNVMETIDAAPVVHGRWIKSNKHIWKKRADGEVDHFAVDFEYHNGPECEICGLHFCEHCAPEMFDDESCKDQYFCSVCGRMEMKEEPYCHCGAKMDGGK